MKDGKAPNLAQNAGGRCIEPDNGGGDWTIAKPGHWMFKGTGVKKGDRILMGKYSGTEVKIDGDEHLIMREDDILGIVEK